jgi:hypothetical protein
MLLIVLAAILAACGNATTPPHSSTSQPAAVGTTQPSAVGTTQPSGVGTTTPSGTDTTPPATGTTPAATAPPVAVGGYSGFGATLTNWATSHVKSSEPVVGHASASYWGPATTSASVWAHKFAVLQVAQSRVIVLVISFPTGTSLKTVNAAVLDQLPADTKSTFSEIIKHDANSNACLLMNLTSPTLGHLLGAAPFNDPSGVVGVELVTVLSAAQFGYDTSNINQAYMQLNPYSSASTC